MTSVLEEVGGDPVDWSPGRRRRLARATVVELGAALLVVLPVALAVRWYTGGTVLHAHGAGYGTAGVTDQQYSYGIELTTASGPSVALDRVSASIPDGVQVSWSIFRNGPGGLGFGSWHGPLLPRWPTSPVHGSRVAQPDGHPERGATWLVATMRASKPGVYHVSHITVHYRSGLRRRSVSGHADLCLLAASPADSTRISRQADAYEPGVTDPATVDPLVVEYGACSDPGATP